MIGVILRDAPDVIQCWVSEPTALYIKSLDPSRVMLVREV